MPAEPSVGAGVIFPVEASAGGAFSVERFKGDIAAELSTGIDFVMDLSDRVGLSVLMECTDPLVTEEVGKGAFTIGGPGDSIDTSPTSAGR